MATDHERALQAVVLMVRDGLLAPEHRDAAQKYVLTALCSARADAYKLMASHACHFANTAQRQGRKEGAVPEAYWDTKNVRFVGLSEKRVKPEGDDGG